MFLERKEKDPLEELNGKIEQLKNLEKEYGPEELKNMPEKEKQNALNFMEKTRNEIEELREKLKPIRNKAA